MVFGPSVSEGVVRPGPQASLASDAAHMCLNGQHFIRTDPSDAPPGGRSRWVAPAVQAPLRIFCIFGGSRMEYTERRTGA